MRISDWSSDVCSSDLIADDRSAGRISDKNAVAERLPAHFAHDSGHRQTAGQPGEAEWACKFGRIGRRGRSRRSQTPAMPLGIEFGLQGEGKNGRAHV